MKKFIRSKIDNTEKSNRSSPNNLPDPYTAATLEASAGPTPEQSPSDTLESPNDSSPAQPASEDSSNGQQSPAAGEASEAGESGPALEESGAPDSNRDEPVKSPPESSIMCRDYVRGMCKRPGTCKYAHKYDTSQLVGVYTFCRNFQNKVCTLPNCKYVHATIFEEQYFYRTGKLPPHVLTPKTLGPPPAATPEKSVEIPTSFETPPPPLPNGLEVNSSVYSSLPSTSSDLCLFRGESNGVESTDEPPLKKCKYCDITPIRYQIMNSALEKKRERVEGWKRKTAEVEANKDKLGATLVSLLDITRNTNLSTASSSLFDFGGKEKSKFTMDQLSKTNLRLSGITEETCKGLLTDSLRSGTYSVVNMLTKLLADYQGRPGSTADTGRKD